MGNFVNESKEEAQPGEVAVRVSGRPAADRIALAAAGVSVLLWASAFVGIRAAGDQLSPGALALLRLVVGSLLLGFLVAWRREPRVPRSDLPRLVICGLLWFAAYNVVLNAGEQRVDAGTAAMLTNVGPVFIAILAGVVLGEGFPGRLLVGCGIAFAGALMIGAATSHESLHAGLGAVLCLGAAAAYAGGMITQKPLLESSSALRVTFLSCVVGALACLPFTPALIADIADADASSLAWGLYLGAFPTAVGFTTWAFALSRSTAGKLGVTTYLVPPLTVLLGWAILSETPPPAALVGGALCLIGVGVTRGATLRRRRP
jgi:drug/metabolite transporter (DMT)-like permease